MDNYARAFANLNHQQRQAVTTIEGPVLVLAGPGTGKTQLLGVRAAYILEQTDTLPQQILCLTFSESGAQNMRERLTRFIGKAAYDVQISTYHAFGSDIIRRFPEAFQALRLQTPVDELTKHRILKQIVESLTYDNPLKQVRHHIGDLIGTMSEVKRALLDADSLRAIATENQTFITRASQDVSKLFARVGRVPTTYTKAAPLFQPLLPIIQKYIPTHAAHHQFGSLATMAAEQLADALTEATQTGKSKPLTAWKNNWLAKDNDNNFIVDGALQNSRITALADVCERYDAELAKNGWYDFDDMIMLAGKALQQHADLRYTLQEQYLYIMLDEFQDTNAAQLQLVQLLTDNPVFEDRPNILAVGDDDQAIYAFQGADYSNMLDFYGMYRDVKVISLTENYRSHADILATAEKISGQIGARLTDQFADTSKKLVQKNPNLSNAHIERRAFMSDIAQYDWIAQHIATLIKKGISPREIAVLAPKHKYLEQLVPYLAKQSVPMRYEKRENILEAPVIKQLLTMSRLLLALHRGDQQTADNLWPAVLSFDFWQIPVRTIWETSWKIRQENGNWSRALLDHQDPAVQTPALLLLALAAKVNDETLEHMLDYLLGTEAVPTHEAGSSSHVRSPLHEYYLGPVVQQTNPGLLYQTVSHLTVLRAKLREYQATQPHTLTLPALIDFVTMYEEAGQLIPSTSPYNQQADAVQLLTVYGAKGLEFTHVFLPAMHDDVWGAAARDNANKLTLPGNLARIRHAATTEDGRLRLLFVALTRAKSGLYLTSFAKNFAGKDTKRLKYLDEQEQEDGSFKAIVLPHPSQAVVMSDHDAPTLETLELNWQQRHIAARTDAPLRQLLHDRLQRYQLSPTDVTRFIDVVYGGPQQVFITSILGFPSAPTVNSQFGDTIHETLEWVQHATDQTGHAPTTDDALSFFSARLQKRQFTEDQRQIEQDRGAKALRAYLAKNSTAFTPGNKAEYRFKNEGVVIGQAHVTGKIDRLDIDHQAKTIQIIDYKTGKPHAKWASDVALHKYMRQLYVYRALVEGSHTFKNYNVTDAFLDFIEPDQLGQIHRLHLPFDEHEYQKTKQLAQTIWQCLQNLDLPDIAQYSQDLQGIKAFENDLLA